MPLGVSVIRVEVHRHQPRCGSERQFGQTTNASATNYNSAGHACLFCSQWNNYGHARQATREGIWLWHIGVSDFAWHY